MLPTLTSVQAQHVGKVDRVTFGFTNGLPADVFVQWVDTLHQDGSGLPVRVAGTKVLMVVFNGATGHDQNGATVRTRTAYALPNVITSVGAGDFEGTVTFGLGVQKRTSYTVTKLQNPDRVVVDVRAGFPTTNRKVWLVDTDAVETGNGPYFVPRKRPIRSDAPAAAALHALFAGPTPQERADGLRLVRSRRLGVRRPADRRRHRPGPADPRLQQRRFDDHRRGRDRADPATVPHRGLGQDLRSRWRHRAAPGAGGLDPDLSGALSRVVRVAAAGRARGPGRP